MQVPFTVEQFFDVFRRYNEAVWPAQWLLVLAALAAVALVLRESAPHGTPRRTNPYSSSGRRAGTRAGARTGILVSGVLAALWLWMGVAYHLAFFRAINPAATLFGIAFVAQAALFAWFGLGRRTLEFHQGRDAAGVVGALALLYALVAYPSLGVAFGHAYPATPTFGLPCPTTIFTLGMLAWARPPLPRVLLVVPVAWAVVGTSAALQLGVAADLGLPVAAIAVLVVVLRRRTTGASGARGTPPAARARR